MKTKNEETEKDLIDRSKKISETFDSVTDLLLQSKLSNEDQLDLISLLLISLSKNIAMTKDFSLYYLNARWNELSDCIIQDPKE